MGNSPRDCGPGGQWLGFIFIWWGIVLMGSCPRTYLVVQWNLVIKRSDITKPSYNKVILLVPTLYISLLFYPDIMRKLI